MTARERIQLDQELYLDTQQVAILEGVTGSSKSYIRLYLELVAVTNVAKLWDRRPVPTANPKRLTSSRGAR
jgi:hypothetical protein